MVVVVVVPTSTLAQKLDMDQDAAERWIVNLIRNAHLDAKIDSAANHVIMGTQNPGVYAFKLLLPLHCVLSELTPSVIHRQIPTNHRQDEGFVVPHPCSCQQSGKIHCTYLPSELDRI